MSKVLVQLDLVADATQAAAILSYGSTAPKAFLQALENLVAGINGGQMDAAVNVKVGADYATLAGTFTGAPTAADTITIAGVAFTARASGAVANEFNIGGTVTITAAAAAAAINASVTAGVAGCVVASSALGVLTVRSSVPGKVGNAIQVAESMTNFAWAGAATRLASGDEDTNVTYVCGKVAETV